ncbi:Uncharacterised protein [Chlamydia trachomatis]|nr:Uncharacterised protein [Chlamydia trachomatis]
MNTDKDISVENLIFTHLSTSAWLFISSVIKQRHLSIRIRISLVNLFYETHHFQYSDNK